MRSLKPWTQMTDPRLEMDRLFDLVFASRLDEFAEDPDSVPSLELTETEDALVLRWRFLAWMRPSRMVFSW